MSQETAQGEPQTQGALRGIDYRADQEALKKFFIDFKTNNSAKYRVQLQEIANKRGNLFEVSLDDLANYMPNNEALVERIMRNSIRYVAMISKAADELMPIPTNQNGQGVINSVLEERIQEVLRQQRVEQELQNAENENNDGEDVPEVDDPRNSLPPSLLRRYEVVLMPQNKVKAGSLREVLASKIGGLVKIRAIVVRVSDVKPVVEVATYQCDVCGFEIYQEVTNNEFLPLQECPTTVCKENQNKGKLHLQTRGSKLVKFQEIKIQEMPDQVPIGHIPRSMDVHATGSCTRQCSPGDCVELVGVFLPEKLNPYRQMKMGLITSTYLKCMHIDRKKKSFAELSDDLSEEVQDQIFDLMDDDEIYSKLARSIAPEIFGLDDVKKALLLQLVSGVTRNMKDGMSIRGDINICLMGDPGVAKSQLLKHIASIAPRGVYTTGKGSSGVGLTAAVTRDKSTGEVALEGGALVLADMGICCIDEFDKMDDADRTAIHEVMEQQTVSIAKAGVTTTLNARTSILAAANPIYGRYNRRLSPTDNINLPAALLSRFDLIFLLLDIPKAESDSALAKHITYVHAHGKHPALDFEPIEPPLLRAYISQARKLEPYIPESLANSIVEEYVEMRQQDLRDAEENGSQSMLTARQLLSILRMSQALARLRFDRIVKDSDIEEAIRLVRASKSSLEEESDDTGNNRRADVTTRIFDIIRDLARSSRSSTVRYRDVEPQILSRGFTSEQLEACLNEYDQLSLIHVSADKNRISLVDAAQEDSDSDNENMSI